MKFTLRYTGTLPPSAIQIAGLGRSGQFDDSYTRSSSSYGKPNQDCGNWRSTECLGHKVIYYGSNFIRRHIRD
jgi:hypothetical protein